MARVVFMGTPEYALPSLRALCADHEVVLVVTQPDRRQGRGRVLVHSPVKAFALEHDLAVWQPDSLRTAEAVPRLRQARAGVFVTAAIGLLLPADVLAIPPHGCLNVHASLLPRWRGAAPIAAAILHGDGETGVTLMQTDEGLDTGPIVAQVRCPIAPTDTTADLTPRLAQLGADLLAETLPAWLRGEVAPHPQPADGVTFAPRLSKEQGLIDWHAPAAAIARMIRAYTPWPGTHTTFQGDRLRILHAEALPEWRGAAQPGQVIVLTGGAIAVATPHGALALLEVQQAGRRAMSIDAFCQGHGELIGAVLGTSG